MKERELRILVTQKCNYKCDFCHKEGIHNIRKELLNEEDYTFLFKFFKKIYGWETLTITGGEPLCKKNIKSITKALFEAGAKITLVSNGSQIMKNLEICNYLSRLNISLHSMDAQKYNMITNSSTDFEKFKYNLKDLKKIFPRLDLRLNCTIVKDLNSSKEEILNILNFSKNIDSSVKFIELLPEANQEDLFFPIEKVGDILIQEDYHLIESSLLQKVYIKDSHLIILSKIVCAISKKLHTARPHCSDTNSVFLTPDGKIQPCMKNKFEIDLLDEIKNKNDLKIKNKMEIFFNSIALLCPY